MRMVLPHPTRRHSMRISATHIHGLLNHAQASPTRTASSDLKTRTLKTIALLIPLPADWIDPLPEAGGFEYKLYPAPLETWKRMVARVKKRLIHDGESSLTEDGIQAVYTWLKKVPQGSDVSETSAAGFQELFTFHTGPIRAQRDSPEIRPGTG